MLRMFPALAALAAVVCTGFVHGFLTDRWVVAAAPGEWAARMDRMPPLVGDWEGRIVKMERPGGNGVAGMLHMIYRNRQTGKEVTLFLVCGRPGPVSVHTPDVCYGAAGYNVVSRGRFAGPAEAPAEFWTAQLSKTQAADQLLLRVFWAWSDNGDWKAPEKWDPRLVFAHCPALFKLYLIREMNAPDEPLDTDPCVDLMKELLPRLQQSLFGGSEG